MEWEIIDEIEEVVVFTNSNDSNLQVSIENNKFLIQ